MPSPKPSWSTRTASSWYFAAITHETLISLVEMASMLMPSFARRRNIREAMPAWLRIPSPTMLTLAMSSSEVTPLAPISRATCSAISRAFWASVRGTVNVRSVVRSAETFWMIMSTEMFAAASGSNIRATMPGSSGSCRTVIFVSFLSLVTPATITASKDLSSPTTQVPGTSLKLDRTCTGTPYFIATSTLRI